MRFIAFSMTDKIIPIAKLGVAGGRTEARLHVHAAPPYSPAQLRDIFAAALLSDPSQLKRCVIVVVYTSVEDEHHWRRTPYSLGWDGRRFVFHDSPEHTISADEYE